MGTSMGSFAELFEQAARVFENALRAGIAMQQESTKWFTETLRGMSSPQQWQARSQAATEQALSTFQKSVDAGLQMMNDNAKTTLDLLEKAYQARQGETQTDGRGQAREMWETAIGALRRNMDMMVHTNARVIESWGAIVRIMCGDNVAQQPPAAQG